MSRLLRNVIATGIAVLALAPAAFAQTGGPVAQGRSGTDPWRVTFGGSAQPVSQSGSWSISFTSAQPVTQSGAWAVSFTTPQHVIVDSATLGTVTVTGALTDTQLRASAVAVDGSGVTQPVSGTVTANQGGSWSATVTQGTATNLKAQAEAYQGGSAVGGSNPLQVTLANTGANSTAVKVDNSAVTQPISAAALPLPSGAATSTKQSDGSQKTQIVDGSGNVIGATSNALDINIKSGNPTSITANAGTNLNTSALALESGGNLATVAAAVHAEDAASADADKGVAVLAVRKATPANTSGTDGDYEPLQVSAGRLWASAVIDSALPAGTNVIGHVLTDSGSTTAVTQSTASNLNATVVGTGTFATQATLQTGTNQIGHLESNQSVNVAQINGVTPLMGNGASGTGAQRVTIASDSTGQIALTTGSAQIGHLEANQSMNLAQVGGSSTVTGGANGTLGVGGTQGNNVAITANPILLGAEARQGQGNTNATAGRIVQLVADRNGRLLTISPKLSVAGSNGTAITTATDTSVVSAPSSGNHLKIYRIHASNSSSTATWVYWRDGASGNKNFACSLPQYGVCSLELNGEWELTTATALYVTTSAAGNVEWTVTYESIPD